MFWSLFEGILGKHCSKKFAYLFVKIGLRQMRMFLKAWEMLYDFDIQSKTQFLDFLGENPIARLNVTDILMLSSQAST